MKARIYYAVLCLLACVTLLNAQEKENVTSKGDTFTYKKLEITSNGERTFENKESIAKESAETSVVNSSGSGIGETPGYLSVSLSGAATYNVPVAVPPGINGIAPEISFSYSSQSRMGIAGYGWNLGGISVITRIPSTNYHDGNNDGIDFDASDRYALDGQRLILKSGTYGAHGAVYETENYSNLKVVSNGVSLYGPASFTVFYPDGSQAIYGGSSANRTPTTYAVSHWKSPNPQQTELIYEYEQSFNNLYIKTIKYGGTSSLSHVNEIRFTYVPVRNHALGVPLQAYVNDVSFKRDKLLSRVDVHSNGSRFRRYSLYHFESYGYPKLNRITEYSGDLSQQHSYLDFDYKGSSGGIHHEGFTTTGLSGVSANNSSALPLDLTGTGRMDYLVYPNAKNKFWLFKDVANGNYSSPFEVNTGSFLSVFSATTLNHQGKILGGQDIGVIQEGSNNSVNFKMYSNGVSNPLNYQYTRTWNQPTYNYSYSPTNTIEKRIPFEYVTGDFNGDGLTEVLAIGKPYTSTSCYYHGDCDDPDPCEIGQRDCDIFELFPQKLAEHKSVDAQHLSKTQKGDQSLEISKAYNIESTLFDDSNNSNNCNYSCYSYTSNYKSIYQIDLDRNNTATYAQYTGSLNEHLTGNYRLLPGDYNGDGQTDIMHITESKKAYVYTFGSNGALELLWTINLLSTYNPAPAWPFMLGDYNGDGKLDFMHATANNSKDFVLGLSTGNGFEMATKEMAFTYTTGTWNGTELKTFNYIPVDGNGDGKTDIVVHRGSSYDSGTGGKLSIEFYENRGSFDVNDDLRIWFEGWTPAHVHNRTHHYPLPLFLSANQDNKNLELASLSHTWLERFSFKSDHRDNFLIDKITNNGVSYEIEYGSLDPSGVNEDGIPYYIKGNDELYPNVDIRVSPDLRVVKQFNRVSEGSPTVKKQFAYYKGVYNVDGLSFLGFKGTTTSNWFTGPGDRFFSTTLYDVNLRGAITAQYTQPLTFNFNLPSAGYIEKTTYQNGSSLSGTKVFKSWVSSRSTHNTVDGTTINAAFEYDTFDNPKSIITDYMGDGTTAVEFEYSNDTGTDYHVGRVTKRTETITIGGDPFSTEQLYTYNGGLLTQIKHKGNGTPYNTIDFEYDNATGNLLKQIFSPDGETPRSVEFEFDPNKRFVKKHTDVEGLETNFQFNTNTGNLLSMTNAYGQTTSYEYDAWNRQVKATDYLGKSVNTSFTEVSNQYTVSVNGDDGSAMISKYDRLQRLSEVQSKDVLGQWSKVKYEYDALDRLIRSSEPYHGANPSQWNEVFYDFYGRPIQQVSHTGRSFDISYSGLTTTVNDGVKTVTSVRDAMGNTKSVTDPGGTINYDYHGNGSLKTTVYEGVIVSVDIDGWGRKTKLTDPSAGIYEYEYNGFNEIVREINPKGETNYAYTPTGRLKSQDIMGDHTDMALTYDYDPTHKQLTRITMESADGNNSSYRYEYDEQVRLKSMLEANPFAEFTKDFTYDAFGRVNTENYYAHLLANGKTSEKKTINVYQNGGLRQIRSHATEKVLWEVNKLNARGQITEAKYGGVQSFNTYDDHGYFKTIENKRESDNANLMTLDYNFNAERGTLNSRTNSMFSWSETFDYDELDRLVSFNDNDGGQSHEYDSFGRIKENSSVGSYNYTGTSFQVAGIDLNVQGDLFYQNNSLKQVSFNAFKSPHEIKEHGKDRIGFQYNAFLGRAHRFYDGFADNVLERKKRKHYSYDGSMEISYDTQSNETAFVTFIGGDTYSAPAIWKSEYADATHTEQYYYLHRDHMNSILLITNEEGAAVEKRHFDAWGNVVRLTDGSGNDLEDFQILDRGYTGHEHLTSVGLIHMNGRLYDPNLRRFMSPDNYIQDISNTQNFNRYGYVLNNPLMYTDPSGEMTEDPEGGGLAGWGAAFVAGAIGNNWDSIKGWRGWREIARPFEALFDGIKGLFGGGKKKPTIVELDNPQNITMDPLTRSSLQAVSPASSGAGEANTGLGITTADVVDTVLDFVPIVGGVKDIYQGVRDGNYWQVAGGVGSIILDVVTLGSSSLIKGAVKTTWKAGVKLVKSGVFGRISKWFAKQAYKVSKKSIETITAAVAKKNAARHSNVFVYVSRSADGVVNYVGITNNLARRAAEHLATKGIHIKELMSGLSRADAKAVEQALIEVYRLGKDGGSLLNKINSISRKANNYAPQIQRGFDLLQSIGF